MEQRWNDIDRGKPKDSEKYLSIAAMFTKNPTWTALGVIVGLRDEKLATNHLSDDTTQTMPPTARLL
jgi:hypothetical protein